MSVYENPNDLMAFLEDIEIDFSEYFEYANEFGPEKNDELIIFGFEGVSDGVEYAFVLGISIVDGEIVVDEVVVLKMERV